MVPTPPTAPTQADLNFTAAALDCWTKAGGRPSRSRESICQAIAGIAQPFCFDQLEDDLRTAADEISRATLYRTLGDLVGFGLLHIRRGIQDEYCYSIVPTKEIGHVPRCVTVVCRQCARLHTLPVDGITMPEEALKAMGFNPLKYEVRIEVTCHSGCPAPE